MKEIGFKKGENVSYLGKRYTIKRILNLHWVLGQDLESLACERLPIASISMIQEDPVQKKESVPLELVTTDQWEIAQQRFEIIKPILENKGNGAYIKEAISLHGFSKSTLYRWIESYELTGKLSSLIPEDNFKGKGQSRLSPEIDEIIKSVIEDLYLKKQKITIINCCKEVLIRCKNAGLKPPYGSTIRKRIHQVSEYKTMFYREGKKAADHKFSPKTGSFPGADSPLSVIQIDHTKLDIIVVDETYRRPIGRPWITLAVDIFSRMVTGFYISLDPPGALGTGLCICNSILPKETTLARLDVSGEWPCWGVMQTIHLDNAKEFRGAMLKRACEEYNIELNWRPVATPHYGGHIERLLGTFLRELHTLPGTTFSNPKDRKNYNSEKEAVFTLFELEKYLTTFIANVYHRRIHKSLSTTPIAKYNEGIFGTIDQIGTGVPARLFAETKLRMPFFERTIQDYGVVMDNVHYYHDVLRRWINSSEPGKGRNRVKKKFIFKRDPRDISVIYFYDPELKEYFPIPYRNTSRPAMSIWEFNEIISKLKDQGKEEFNEDMIFEAYDILRKMESEAIKKTLKTKKNNHKALRRSESREKNIDIKLNLISSDTVPILMEVREFKPFDDIEL
jgi:putative transposase